MRNRLLTAAFVGALALAAPATQAEPVGASGSGASFPAKVYQLWAEQYGRDTGVKIEYLPSGSSAGVRQIVARAVDFGATDVPLSAAELDKHGLFQFPTLVGGVVPVVNLPGVASGALRLDAAVLGAIFGGRVARWDDAAIASLNPGLRLPALPIERVVRADGSGTTEVFVAYLKVTGTAIELDGGRARWPGEVTAAEGSGKLAQAVKSRPGAIGYISSDYLAREQLAAVSLRNRRGEWIAPGLAAFGAAIRAGALFKHGLEAAPLLDLDGTGVWPIVTATYVVVPRAPSAPQRAGRALNFFYRSFLLGDKAVAGTGFAPLPTPIQARIVALLAGFRTPDGQPLPVMSAPEEARQAAAR